MVILTNLCIPNDNHCNELRKRIWMKQVAILQQPFLLAVRFPANMKSEHFSGFYRLVGFFQNFRVELNVFFKALHLSLLLSPLALWIILTWLGNKYFSETEEDLNALFSRRIV